MQHPEVILPDVFIYLRRTDPGINAGFFMQIISLNTAGACITAAEDRQKKGIYNFIRF